MARKHTQVTNALVLLAKLLVLAMSFEVAHLLLYCSNQDLQLPLVQHANDPSLFPNDPYVATLPYYISFLWQILWVPFRFLPEMPLLVGLTLVQRLLILSAAGKLGRTLSGGSRLAELACWILFGCGVVPLAGWGTIVPAYFEHTSLAVAAYLMCVAALVEHRPVRAGVWFGLCALCNVMHAAHGAGLLLVALALVPELRRLPDLTPQASRRTWTIAVGTAALVGLPPIGMAVWGLGAPHIQAAKLLTVLRFYFPFHSFPSTWAPTVLWLLALGLAGTSALAAAPVLDRSVRRLMAGLTVGFVLYLTLAVVAEASGSATLAGLQFARAADLWCAVAAVFGAASAVQTVRKNPERPWAYAAGSALGIACVLLWFVPGSSQFLPGVIVASTSVCVIGLGAMLGWHRHARFGVPAAVLTSFAAFPMVSMVQQFGSPTDLAHVPYTEIPRNEWEAAAWAKANTPVGAKFLVSPRWSAWRVLSRRSCYVTWKDGAGLMWYPPYALEWNRRVRDLGVDTYNPRYRYPTCLAVFSAAYAAVTDREAGALARKYRLDYWILPVTKATQFRVVESLGDVKVVAFQ